MAIVGTRTCQILTGLPITTAAGYGSARLAGLGVATSHGDGPLTTMELGLLARAAGSGVPARRSSAGLLPSFTFRRTMGLLLGALSHRQKFAIRLRSRFVSDPVTGR